jgi:hypothetical protein
MTSTSHAATAPGRRQRSTALPLALVAGIPLGAILYLGASMGSYAWSEAFNRSDLFAGMFLSCLMAVMGVMVAVTRPRIGVVSGIVAAVLLLAALVIGLVAPPASFSGTAAQYGPALLYGGSSAVTGTLVCSVLVAAFASSRDRRH